MKRVILFWFTLCFWNCSVAQKQYLTIRSQSSSEQKSIDSIGYTKEHVDAKSVVTEIKSFSEKVLQIGYIEADIEKNQKTNDSTFLCQIKLRKKTSSIHIYIRPDSVFKNLLFKDTKKDTLILPFYEVESYLKQALALLEKKGFALSKIQLINFEKKQNQLVAELHIQSEKLRNLDDIVINGYTKFPESHRRQLKRIYKKRFSIKTILKKCILILKNFVL